MAAVVQQVTGSSTEGYGLGTTSMSSSEGNTLVAFIGWNCAHRGTHVPIPAVSVSDSAGNLWRQIAITQAGGSFPTRCSIWAAVNALPVDWISVGLAGHTASAAWTIAEISGLAQGLALDYSLGVNSSGTSPSLSGIASQSDTGFALFLSGSGTQTLTGVTGWTALTGGSAGSATSGSVIFPYWRTGIGAGTVTAGGTFGSSASYSMVHCAITTASSPPPQPDYRYPLIVTEAAFGAVPGDITFSLDYTYTSEMIQWTDISNRVLGGPTEGRLSGSRGRQYELQQEEAGTMTVYLDNHDGAFTPSNPGSPYYSTALNQNMSFQTGLTDWTGTAFTGVVSISQSDEQAFASAPGATAVYSMKVTGGSVNTPAARSGFAPVNQNYVYTSSAWFYVPPSMGTVSALVGFQWYNAAGTLLGASNGTGMTVSPGVWTQIIQSGVSPLAGAATARIVPTLPSVYGSGVTFYLAEAAMVAGTAPVQTGLVRLETPVRVTGWWQGRQYPLWMGYVERWPQSWPELPQWGFSQITATDSISVAAANSMYSALIGDVLTDNPAGYLPCNEQYTSATVGATVQFPILFGTSPYYAPADANGLIALNKATGNQVTGTYFDGQGAQQVSTGLAINFLGDDGTGMGATGYSGNAHGSGGPAMLYADPALPGIAAGADGFTIEFWFLINAESDETNMMLVMGAPSAFAADNGTGTYSNGTSIVVSYDAFGAFGVEINGGATTLSNSEPITDFGVAHHFALVFAPPAGSQFAQLYIDGVLVSTGSVSSPYVAMNAIIMGPGRYSYDCYLEDGNSYDSANYVAAQLAVYSYQLDASRIASHYNTGISGQTGVGAATRFAQILDWAQLGLKRGGYSQSQATGSREVTEMGPAYQLNGSTASDAVNSVAQSEGGRYYVKGDGTFTYLERTASYNQAEVAILGDDATAAPDIAGRNPGIAPSGAGWTALGGSVSYQAAMAYGPLGTLLFTPTGMVSTKFAVSPAGPVQPGAEYTTGAWVYTPVAGTISSGFVWGPSETQLTGGNFVPGSAWTFISTSGTMPAGVTMASLGVSSGNGTAATPFYIAAGGIVQVSPEVPYMQETAFDYDNTYVYNEVQSTMESGPNQLTVYDYLDYPSQQAYFRRSALSIESSVVSPYDVSDGASWAIAQFAQPVIHVSGVKVHASANPMTAFPAVLSLDIGDIVRVTRRPVGGAVISELGIIERVQYELGSRYFYVTYQLSPYQPSNSVLCADTPGFDIPDDTILGW